ncbi:MAG: UDP-N-acetylmuramoyl-L-alanine--D-glutamate ligase [Patescibacteria group bacterium]
MSESWKGKKVLILGLGQYPKGSGVSAALFVARQGADVLVTDQKTEQDLAANVKQLKRFKNVTFRLGEHRLEDIRWADVIIRNPRVRPDSPEMKLATKLGKRVESDVSIFLKECRATVVGITGTRGKSTTSTLVADMLKASKKKVWLGGNILVSPLTFADKVKPTDIVVLELSSWLLETTGAAGISPHVACVTNMMRDHLNTYEGMEDYAEAKAQVFRHQSMNDVVVLNGDDAYGKEWAIEAPASVRLFTVKKRKGSNAWIEGNQLMLRYGHKNVEIAKIGQLKVFGAHNHLNMLAAALTAQASGANIPAIRSALKNFSGLQDRQEIVTVKRGITYINDTTATTPDGTIAALEALSPRFKKIHLILGGADKDLEFEGLARLAKRLKPDIVVLQGTAHDKMLASFKKVGVGHQDVASLKDAVATLKSRAASGDAIVLSPGCASFGQFKNEFDRGEQFRKLAKT